MATTTVNISAVFSSQRSLLELSAAALAKGICENGSLGDIFNLHRDVAAYVIYQLSEEKLVEFVKTYGSQEVSKFFVEHNCNHLLACLASRLEKAEFGLYSNVSNRAARKVSNAFHYHVDTAWKLNKGTSPVPMYDSLGILYRVGGSMPEKSDNLMVSGCRVNISQHLGSPHKAYIRAKHHKRDAVRGMPVPKLLWGKRAQKDILWHAPGRVESSDSDGDSSPPPAKQSKWVTSTAESTASFRFVSWASSGDLTESLPGRFKQLGPHSSRAFYYTFAYAQAYYVQQSYPCSLGHVVQVYCYYVATVDGWTRDRFDAEVKERRFDMYLLLAAVLSKFGDSTANLCKLFLAKASSLLSTSAGVVQDARHQQVLLAAQDVFLSLGFLDAEETSHFALHRLLSVSRSSIYYVKSCLLHAEALMEVIENCLAFMSSSYIRHLKCNASCDYQVGYQRIRAVARYTVRELEYTMTRVALAASLNDDYYSDLNIGKYEELACFYDILVSGFQNVRLRCPRVETKLDILMVKPSFSSFLTGLYRVLKSDGSLHVNSTDEQILCERKQLKEQHSEPIALAKAVFSHCVRVLCTTILGYKRGKVLFASMTPELEQLSKHHPSHHRLAIMTYLEDCCFTTLPCSEVTFEFSASTFLSPDHHARKSLAYLDKCACTGPRAQNSSLCKCYEVQEKRAKEWMTERSHPVPGDRQMVQMLLKSSPVLCLPNLLPRPK